MSTNYSESNVTESRENIHTQNVVFSTAMLISIMALGIFGNSLVMASFIKFRRLRTVTNYFLISLAAADLMLASLSIPFWLIIRLENSHIVSKLSSTVIYMSWQFIDILCSTASIMNLCVIAIDRHLAIVSPLHYSSKMTPKRAISSIAAGWIYALVCAGLSLVFTKSDMQPLLGRVYAAFISLAAFLFPLCIVLFYYGKIFTVALKQARSLNSQNTFVYGAERERRTLIQRELKIAKTLAFVVGTFIVCWAPFFLVLLSYSVCGVRCISATNAYIAATKWMQYSSTTANPIIYTLFTKAFREAFKAMLYCPDYRLCPFKPCANHLRKLSYKSTMGNERFIIRSTINNEGELVTQICAPSSCTPSPLIER